MRIQYKENQFELFSTAPQPEVSSGVKPRLLRLQLTFSFDQLTILTICSIFVMIFVFSLGIEKGKRLVSQSSDVMMTQVMDHEKPHEAVIEKTKEPLMAEEMDSSVMAKQVTQAIVDDVAVASQKGFTVQLVSYLSEAPALREAENLKNKGYQDVYVLNKGKYIILCVGNFSSKEGAQQLTKKLKTNYQDLLVRRL